MPIPLLSGSSFPDNNLPQVLYKNVNVTTIMFLMSGDLTGLCLYIYKGSVSLQ